MEQIYKWGNRMLKKSMFIFIFILSFLLVSCTQQKNINNKEKDLDDHREAEIITNHVNYSIWITYWDIKDLESEIESIQNSIDNICYFAAYFDQDKEPFIPSQTIESFKTMKDLYGHKGYGNYLTFVNDLILKDGTSSLKDVDLLYTLFETEESMNHHIEEILSMTISEGFDGIEIDYEAIKKDIELWELFIEFVNRLYQSANEKNILVRVLLEPNVPIDMITLPEGPEYVMMCYNLYGYGTKPGPKANKGFIEDLIKKMEGLPGEINFALATGGYDFYNNGKVNALTEKEAVELIKVYNKSTMRDKESQALFFHYIDHEGISHEVWYADQETIKYWTYIIQEAGDYGISIWRMGGNVTLKDGT